jgi:hypothetical protein
MAPATKKRVVGMFDRFRRIRLVDRVFRAIEAYTSLGEQYPWLKWLINAGVAIVLGGWTLSSGSLVPLAIVIVLGCFLFLSLLPFAIQQSGSALAKLPVAASENPDRPSDGIETIHSELLKVRQHTFQISNRLKQIEQDLTILLHFAVDEATYDLLDNIINTAPSVEGLAKEADDNIRHSRIHNIDDFVSRAIAPFHNTHRGMSINSVLNRAGAEAEAYVKSVPLSDLPSYLDQLDFLKCSKLEMECTQLLAFFVAERVKKREQIIQQRSKLAERMSDRES